MVGYRDAAGAESTAAAPKPPLQRSCKGEREDECLTAPLHFCKEKKKKICSSFFVVKCRGKLDGLAKQRWMFSLKRSADGAHSRGKLCKSLH